MADINRTGYARNSLLDEARISEISLAEDINGAADLSSGVLQFLSDDLNVFETKALEALGLSRAFNNEIDAITFDVDLDDPAAEFEVSDLSVFETTNPADNPATLSTLADAPEIKTDIHPNEPLSVKGQANELNVADLTPISLQVPGIGEIRMPGLADLKNNEFSLVADEDGPQFEVFDPHKFAFDVGANASLAAGIMNVYSRMSGKDTLLGDGVTKNGGEEAKQQNRRASQLFREQTLNAFIQETSYLAYQLQDINHKLERNKARQAELQIKLDKNLERQAELLAEREPLQAAVDQGRKEIIERAHELGVGEEIERSFSELDEAEAALDQTYKERAEVIAERTRVETGVNQNLERVEDLKSRTIRVTDDAVYIRNGTGENASWSRYTDDGVLQTIEAEDVPGLDGSGQSGGAKAIFLEGDQNAGGPAYTGEAGTEVTPDIRARIDAAIDATGKDPRTVISSQDELVESSEAAADGQRELNDLIAKQEIYDQKAEAGRQAVSQAEDRLIARLRELYEDDPEMSKAVEDYASNRERLRAIDEELGNLTDDEIRIRAEQGLLTEQEQELIKERDLIQKDIYTKEQALVGEEINFLSQSLAERTDRLTAIEEELGLDTNDISELDSLTAQQQALVAERAQIIEQQVLVENKIAQIETEQDILETTRESVNQAKDGSWLSKTANTIGNTISNWGITDVFTKHANGELTEEQMAVVDEYNATKSELSDINTHLAENDSELDALNARIAELEEQELEQIARVQKATATYESEQADIQQARDESVTDYLSSDQRKTFRDKETGNLYYLNDEGERVDYNWLQNAGGKLMYSVFGSSDDGEYNDILAEQAEAEEARLRLEEQQARLEEIQSEREATEAEAGVNNDLESPEPAPDNQLEADLDLTDQPQTLVSTDSTLNDDPTLLEQAGNSLSAAADNFTSSVANTWNSFFGSKVEPPDAAASMAKLQGVEPSDIENYPDLQMLHQFKDHPDKFKEYLAGLDDERLQSVIDDLDEIETPEIQDKPEILASNDPAYTNTPAATLG